MGLRICLRRSRSSIRCAVWRSVSVGKFPAGREKRYTAEAHPSTPVVEEYQITFWCDNFFLLRIISEITLANVSLGEHDAGTRYEERDETPVSLED
jgi:hypothetical protein